MTNRDIVLAYMDLIAAQDLDGALALAHDDATFQGPDGSVIDKAGLRALFAQLAPLLVNPMEFNVTGTTVEGARVAVEATGRTLLANGREYANIYHFLFEVRDGRIAASREYCDTSRAAAFAP